MRRNTVSLIVTIEHYGSWDDALKEANEQAKEYYGGPGFELLGVNGFTDEFSDITELGKGCPYRSLFSYSST